MKKIVLVVSLMMVMALNAAQAAELKVGVVNFQKALNEVEQGKKAKAALKAEFDAKQKKLQIQEDELKKMQAEFEKQKAVLSQDALMAKQKTFQEKYTDLQKNFAGYRDELVGRESKMTSQILQNLKTVVAALGQKGGFTLVMESSADTVLYVQSKEDLTDEVIKAYNSKFTGPLKDAGKE
ncbi:MAG: OmpH family outer membrane protein [Deltaproteobacteria bacterium]|nr:MAG: OmpH family outer membrane protein [Deltaproteobacteria bacterium]